MNLASGAQERGRDAAADLAPNAPDWLQQQLAWWLSDSPRFADFCERHRTKIAAKFRHAKDMEDQRDVHAELEVAWRLLGNHAFRNVDYEPKKKGPDFRVSTPHLEDFYVEVKRIRETAVMSRFHGCIQAIITRLREVPSSLDFSLLFGVEDALGETDDSGEAYVKTLEGALDSLVVECVEGRCRHENRLELGASVVFHPGVFSDLEVTFTRNDRPQDSLPSLLCISYLLPFTQKEDRKFADVILNSLRQIREGAFNVLVIITHSYTHIPEELDFAIRLILKLLQTVENESFFRDKGFQGIQDFTRRLSFLSAAVVIAGTTRAGEEPNSYRLVRELNPPFLPRDILGCLSRL